MRLPVGFKINGVKVAPMLPRVAKMISVLQSLPPDELLTSPSLAAKVKFSLNGGIVQESDLQDFREKVDGRLLWGSRESIAKLRKHLAEPEDITDEN